MFEYVVKISTTSAVIVILEIEMFRSMMDRWERRTRVGNNIESVVLSVCGMPRMS